MKTALTDCDGFNIFKSDHCRKLRERFSCRILTRAYSIYKRIERIGRANAIHDSDYKRGHKTRVRISGH